MKLRTSVVAVAFAATSLVTTAAATGQGGKYAFCPPARTTAASHLDWKHHRLAPGVSLSTTTMHGDRGKVEVSALRVDLTHPGVSVAPLHRALSAGNVLTSLAARPHLVAATNGMYFNLTYGAPKVPFISHGKPRVLSATPARVAGIGADNRAEAGNVWLAGTVRSGSAIARLVAVNHVAAPRGISIYNGLWGSRRVALPDGARSREVVHGHIHSHLGRHRHTPRHGELLVGRGKSAVRWLRSLAGGARVDVHKHVGTDAPVRFVQAYGVGTQTVERPDQISTGLYCSHHMYYAARTAIAWTRNRSTLMLVTVESPRAPDHYGLDENQVSALLIHLRAAAGFALDGGGSTEMVVRRPGHKHLSLATVAHGNRQRRIPVGVGVYFRR